MYQGVCNQRAGPFEFPGALDERTVDLGECVEREGLSLEFQLQGVAAEYVFQHRVLDIGLQMLPGVFQKEFVYRKESVLLLGYRVGDLPSDIFQEGRIGLQLFAGSGEELAKGFRKFPIAVAKTVASVSEEDLVKTVRIQLVPRKVHKVQIAEDLFQNLALAQGSHIMETGVIFLSFPGEALQTASRGAVLFQNAHILSVFS